MDKGVLFIGHSSDAQEKIIIGIRGTADHVAMISPEEAVRFAEHILATVERMEKFDNHDHPERDKE